MKDIDICMMTTANGQGTLHSRPMTNNEEVEYDSKSCVSAYEDSQKVLDIRQIPLTSMTYQGKDGLYIHIYSDAVPTDEKEKMADHGSEDLNQWFPDGLETEGLMMNRVDAKKAHYWQNEKEGEVSLN